MLYTNRWYRIALGLMILAAVLVSTSAVLAHWPICLGEAGMQEARETPCSVVPEQDMAKVQSTGSEAELTLVAAMIPEGTAPDELVPFGIAYSPDGAQLVTAMAADAPIVWDAATGEQIFELEGHTATARAVAWSPDAATIASGSDDGTVILWDAETGEALHTLDANFFFGNGVAFSPDSHQIAATGGNGRTLRIWDVATGGLLSDIAVGRVPFFIAWSPDGAQIAVSSLADETGGKVFVYDADSGELVIDVTMPDSNTTGLAYSPDGTRLLSGAFQAEIAQEWDAVTGEPLVTLMGHTQPVVWAAYSPDGTLIATSSFDGARLWDAATGEELLTLTASPLGIPRAIFSPDGVHLATMQLDGTARIYNLPDLLDQ